MRSGQRETVTLMSTVKIQLLGLLLLISSCPFGAHGAQPPSKLKIGILKRPEACALKSKAGDLLSVYSVGKVHKTNKVFDEREVVGEPFKFLLGEGQVIRGWEQGLLGMCIGEVRRLVIPSELGEYHFLKLRVTVHGMACVVDSGSVQVNCTCIMCESCVRI
eukprot:m.101510 g.101510  ORF g.101510 m.101510 type:complete len:162 (-) comp20758_c0_seq2:362-847(-)